MFAIKRVTQSYINNLRWRSLLSVFVCRCKIKLAFQNSFSIIHSLNIKQAPQKSLSFKLETTFLPFYLFFCFFFLFIQHKDSTPYRLIVSTVDFNFANCYFLQFNSIFCSVTINYIIFYCCCCCCCFNYLVFIVIAIVAQR